jgi:7-cyano-7-deazaguanine reductase
MNNKLDNTAISKVLGKRVDVPKSYDKKILVREPRASNRKYLNINDNKLPFTGVDVWNNWEISALTDTGLPVTGIGKITYPCSSKYIVESKSAKLYFNSFNMTKMGKTPKQVISNIEKIASKDLSEFLQTKVTVDVFNPSVSLGETFFNKNEWLNLDLVNPKLATDVYNETPSLLQVETSNTKSTQKFYSTLLRSNCRVTGQPDAGDVYIQHTSDISIVPESLLKYIISFRNECHFHEEICECLYTRLNQLLNPKELMVACLYVRRGSLDINPVRSSHKHLIPDFFTDRKKEFAKSPRQ